VTTDLKDQLRALGLRHTADTLDDLVALATRSRWGAQQILEHVARVEAAVRLDFLEKAHNVVLVAPQGLGKTMIAQNIAHAAVLAGHSVLFTTAAQMLLDLGAQDSARGLDQRLRHYCNRTGLLVIDEIGYLSYDNRNADLLFQVVSRRYERKSVVITTNRLCRVADHLPQRRLHHRPHHRLVHHSEIISIEGESYRKREAELAKEETTTRRRKKRS
jgi:DNA replication protein DnaC